MSDPTVDIEDLTSLLAYLRETHRIAPDESPETRVLAGGVSNKTVLVRRPSGEAWVLKQALPKLRTAADWYSDPSRIRREALGLTWLPKLAPDGTTTPLVFQDDANHLLAMAAVPAPHENWKAMLLAGRVEPDHVAQFGRLLGRVHRAAHERRAELAPLFDDRSFFESLRLEPYYGYTATREARLAMFLWDLIDLTRATRHTLVHGDYSPKNVLVHDGRLVLLDHEVIHWGDGAFDLGFALAHLLSKANHLPPHRDVFLRAAVTFWATYLEDAGATGGPLDDLIERRAVLHALGCLAARVAGRSPLEYLSPDERDRQLEAAVALAADPPATVADLARQFAERL